MRERVDCASELPMEGAAKGEAWMLEEAWALDEARRWAWGDGRVTAVRGVCAKTREERRNAAVE